MEKSEVQRIKKRAIFLLDRSGELDNPLKRAVMKGDAADTLYLIGYIERLEKAVLYAPTNH